MWSAGLRRSFICVDDTAVIVRLHWHFRRSTSTGRNWSTSSSAVRNIGSRRIELALGRVASAWSQRVLLTVCVGTASAVRRVDGLRRQSVATRRVALSYTGADVGSTAVCWLQQYGGKSAACVIVIATIYPRFTYTPSTNALWCNINIREGIYHVEDIKWVHSTANEKNGHYDKANDKRYIEISANTNTLKSWFRAI